MSRSSIFSKGGGKSTVNVNGRTITVSGNDISIINGKVYSDGILVEGDLIDNSVTIKIEGPIANITSDRSLTVIGNVTGDVNSNGSVNCDDIKGNVSANGSINCDDISGNATAQGSINCDDIGGDATATKIRK